jgi:hypothetical protein
MTVRNKIGYPSFAQGVEEISSFLNFRNDCEKVGSFSEY